MPLLVVQALWPGASAGNTAAEVWRLTANSEQTMESYGLPRHWLFRDAVYETTERLTAQEVKALATRAENRQRAKIAVAVGLMDHVEQLSEHGRREPIPDDVKVFVWQRDRGACVNCGGRSQLEFDHVVPLSMGGSNTERNLQLLCEACNRAKGANLI
jgi:hypothetical protein